MRREVIAGQPLDLEAQFAQPLLHKVDLPVLKCYAAFPTGPAPAASADPSRWVGVHVRKEPTIEASGPHLPYSWHPLEYCRCSPQS
jgi:hypothetical protein